MATKKKMLQAAAGAGGGEALNVEDVFSTYLYEGTSATHIIDNGIDLDGEGGLVWFKNRENSFNHYLVDSERGVNSFISSNNTNVSQPSSSANSVISLNSNGFTLGTDDSDYVNKNDQPHASWSFRKARKFFDIVTYSGNGSNSRTIPHSLGSVPGMIMIKRLNSSTDWMVYHRGVNNGTNPANYYLTLNGTDAAHETASPFNNTTPTESVFSVGGSANTNHSSGTYVAYLFAHNDDDGGFGPDGDQDIIKCGYATSPVSAQDLEINLGFEPQFVMYKLSGTAGSWYVHDSMRSLTNNDATDPTLYWNASYHETQITSNNFINPTATGFRITENAVNQALGTNANFVYFAIRRGTKVPESATEVFDAEQGGSSVPDNTLATTTGFPVDMFMHFDNYTSGGENFVVDRLRGSRAQVRTQYANAEAFYSTNNPSLDSNTGLINRSGSTQNLSGGFYWQWKRAPGFFDAVAYQGTGIPGFTFNHNLGVVPEMMWVKARGGTEYWAVYHKDLNGGTNPSHYFLKLNGNNAETDYNEIWNDTEPTATQVTVGSQGVVNHHTYSQIAYLFASLDGISKVGSYTGNGESVVQTIDCGFTSGARFVLIKKSSSTGEWIVYDAERGISTATSDGVLLLNRTNAESPESLFFAGNAMQPDSSGFKVTTDDLNRSGDTYIFYAIA